MLSRPDRILAVGQIPLPNLLMNVNEGRYVRGTCGAVLELSDGRLLLWVLGSVSPTNNEYVHLA